MVPHVSSSPLFPFPRSTFFFFNLFISIWHIFFSLVLHQRGKVYLIYFTQLRHSSFFPFCTVGQSPVVTMPKSRCYSAATPQPKCDEPPLIGRVLCQTISVSFARHWLFWRRESCGPPVNLFKPSENLHPLPC